MDDELLFHTQSNISFDAPNAPPIQMRSIQPIIPDLPGTSVNHLIFRILVDFICDSAQINIHFSSALDLVRLKFNQSQMRHTTGQDTLHIMGLIISSIFNTISMFQPQALDPIDSIQLDVMEYCLSHPLWKIVAQSMPFSRIMPGRSMYLPQPSPYPLLRSWILDNLIHSLSISLPPPPRPTMTRTTEHQRQTPNHPHPPSVSVAHSFYPNSAIPNTSQMDDHLVGYPIRTNSLYVSSSSGIGSNDDTDGRSNLLISSDWAQNMKHGQPQSKRKFGEDATNRIIIPERPLPATGYHKPNFEYLPTEAPPDVIPLMAFTPEIGSRYSTMLSDDDNDDDDGYNDYGDDSFFSNEYRYEECEDSDEGSYRNLQKERHKGVKHVVDTKRIVQIEKPVYHTGISPSLQPFSYSYPTFTPSGTNLTPQQQQPLCDQTHTSHPSEDPSIISIITGTKTNSHFLCTTKIDSCRPHAGCVAWNDRITTFKLLSIPSVQHHLNRLISKYHVESSFSLVLGYLTRWYTANAWHKYLFGSPTILKMITLTGMDPLHHQHHPLSPITPMSAEGTSQPSSSAPASRVPCVNVHAPGADQQAPATGKPNNSGHTTTCYCDIDNRIASIPDSTWLHAFSDSSLASGSQTPHAHLHRILLSSVDGPSPQHITSIPPHTDGLPSLSKVWEVQVNTPLLCLDTIPLLPIWAFFMFTRELLALAAGPVCDKPNQHQLYDYLDLSRPPSLYHCHTNTQSTEVPSTLYPTLSYLSHIIQAKVVEGSASGFLVPMTSLTPQSFSHFMSAHVMPHVKSGVQSWVLSTPITPLVQLVSSLNTHITQFNYKPILSLVDQSLFQTDLVGVNSLQLLRDCSTTVGGDLFSNTPFSPIPPPEQHQSRTFLLMDTNKQKGVVQRTLKQMFGKSTL